MTRNHFSKILLSCILPLIVFVSGCIHIGCCNKRVKYERTVKLSARLVSGSAFAAQTHNGSIAITGGEVVDCNVVARITARGTTEEEAKRIAEETKLKLEAFGKKLTFKIVKPTFVANPSVSVSLKATVPNKTDLELVTHNGSVDISNIVGQIDSTTHNGDIVCKEIAGDVKLRTHNGSIKAYYRKSARPICNASIVTHNGGINFIAPLNFSATIQASTHNGSIKTDFPIVIVGEITKRKLMGTIGSGEGKLDLKTHNGSITIKQN